MLLSLYASTAIASFGFYASRIIGVRRYLKKKGYKFVGEDSSSKGAVLSTLLLIFISILPVINVITPVALISKGNKLYEDLEEKLLEKGAIYKPEEENNNHKDDISKEGFLYYDDEEKENKEIFLSISQLNALMKERERIRKLNEEQEAKEEQEKQEKQEEQEEQEEKGPSLTRKK